MGTIPEYFSYLDAQGIILDIEKRQAAIQAQIKNLAEAVNGEIPDDPDLLAEVTNLVEARITSYNVCYTKLLRTAPGIHRDDRCRTSYPADPGSGRDDLPVRT